MEEQNKKLEAIMNKFNELSYDEKREKVISLVEGLGDSETYGTTLEILTSFEPEEDYIVNIYRVIMETKLKAYESKKEQDKIEAKEKMEEYIKRLNELSMKQKEQDEKEADDLLANI